ncbi:hypothetical protein BGW41_005892 [Actinomortierella wolfii]|nr:hypothetical protein BGW41_005892 [Actinomortierella wolfii]
MLKFVKEGAIDILALTLPSSLLESIRQISEEELLPPPQLSHKQRQPRARTQKQAQEALNRRRHLEQDGLLHSSNASLSNDQSAKQSTSSSNNNSNGKSRSRTRTRRKAKAKVVDHPDKECDSYVTLTKTTTTTTTSTTQQLGQQQSLIAVNHDDNYCRSCERSLNGRNFNLPAECEGDRERCTIHSLYDNHEKDGENGDGTVVLDDSDYDSIDVDSDYDSTASGSDDLHGWRGIQDLPYEVLAHIFGFLPASDLMSTLSVCRQWRQIALLETRQADISECFPQDCLGLDRQEEYSDFDFVVHLFSTFPLISTIVIKERYLRDRDLRVVTAGILAGKMAFTHWSPRFAEMERQYQLHLSQASSPTSSPTSQQDEKGLTGEEQAPPCNHEASSHTGGGSTRIVPKIMRGSIKEELSRFSKSVARYVLVPQTRNTLRKKILEQLQANLEQKHQQDYWWMVEEGFQPERRPPVDAATITEKHALVPITHYRFQDCCFANDWGANMDLNKLPMIGLAAAISHQGLVVDLDGSYGAPSKSVKTMLGFCFGPNCVISLAFGFRHTHMELEHVTEMISENNILYRMDIVDAPAYQELIFLPALRGLGRLQTEMQRCCLELDEYGLEHRLKEAATVFQGLTRDFRLAEEIMEERESEDMQDRDRKAKAALGGDQPLALSSSHLTRSSRLGLLKSHGVGVGGGVAAATANFVDPIEELAEQLVFPPSMKDKIKDRRRTARVLLQSVVSEGLKGLLSTRDKTTGQTLLHTLAWRKHYLSTVAQLESEEAPHANSNGLNAKKREGRRKHANPSKTSASTRSTSMDSIFSFGAQQQHRSAASSSSSSPLEHLDHYHQQSGVATPQPRSAALASETTGFSLATAPSLASLRAALPAALSFPLTFRRRSLPLIWFGSSPPRFPVRVYDSDSSDDSSESSDSDAESSAGDSDHGLDEGEEEAAVEDEHGGDDDENKSSDIKNGHDDERLVDRLLVDIPWSREERRQLARLEEGHPILVALRMAKVLLDQGADPNVFNNDGRPAAVCASFMGFQPMETLLVQHGGVLKELMRIRETM